MPTASGAIASVTAAAALAALSAASASIFGILWVVPLSGVAFAIHRRREQLRYQLLDRHPFLVSQGFELFRQSLGKLDSLNYPGIRAFG